MSFRGRGRGRGGFGGGGGFRPAKQVPFELFPEIEGLGNAEYSTENIQLIKWSSSLQKYWNSSPYFYEDGRERTQRVQQPDIERYSDRNLQSTKAKPPLWHFIKLDTDHVPTELARGDKKEKHAAKRVRWNPESDLQKQDPFEKLLQKDQVQEGNEKKEDEDEEEDEERNEEDEGEFSDEGDYDQPEYFDDDEDDYNMADDNNGMLNISHVFCFAPPVLISPVNTWKIHVFFRIDYYDTFPMTFVYSADLEMFQTKGFTDC